MQVKLGKFSMPSDLPAEARDLIRRMLEVDPSKRITMEKIRVHPFFTRRPPRPQRGLVDPPTPDQVLRPVARKEDIDSDILKNLKTLWNGSSEEEVVQALVGKE